MSAADAAKARVTADADATRMKTAVVILNWNTEGFLKEFLPSLLRSTEKVQGAEVVVADNASTDGSMKVMSELFPDVKTISFDCNYGFTGGYNKAFQELDQSEKPEYFLLINSDIEVTENWLKPLVEWMDTHPECGACAPKLHSYQERDKFEYAGAAGGYLDKVRLSILPRTRAQETGERQWAVRLPCRRDVGNRSMSHGQKFGI